MASAFFVRTVNLNMLNHLPALGCVNSSLAALHRCSATACRAGSAADVRVVSPAVEALLLGMLPTSQAPRQARRTEMRCLGCLLRPRRPVQRPASLPMAQPGPAWPSPVHAPATRSDPNLLPGDTLARSLLRPAAPPMLCHGIACIYSHFFGALRARVGGGVVGPRRQAPQSSIY